MRNFTTDFFKVQNAADARRDKSNARQGKARQGKLKDRRANELLKIISFLWLFFSSSLQALLPLRQALSNSEVLNIEHGVPVDFLV